MRFLMIASAWALALASAAHATVTSVSEPEFNEVYRNSTHNSYWVLRSPIWDPFATGVQERILDQLLFERARALEIDIHKDPARAGGWRVYHTDIQHNVFCTPLDECLKQLEQFQRALPQHEAVVVVLELKEILDYNFDSTHTPGDLDRLIERRLGPYLFRPRDLLSRCAPGLSLRECVAQEGWPTSRELRGKLIFAPLGNWRWCTIGHGPSGWATYATWRGPGETPDGPAVAARSLFPMESDFGDWTHGDSCGNEGIPEPERDEAIQSSVFLQVETLGPTGHIENIPEFLARGGIIRADGTPTLATQQDAFDQGMQMLQTDYPWLSIASTDWAQVVRELRPASTEPILEPGERLALLAPAPGATEAFAPASASQTDTTDWDTFVSSTRPTPDAGYPNPRLPGGRGCLRAESQDGLVSASVCREVDAHTQQTVVTAELRRHGLAIWRRTFRGGINFSNGIGDELRLTSWPNPDDGGTCVSLMTSSELEAPGQPRWTPLKTHCFDVRLPRQGLAASRGDVLFVRARLNDRPLSAGALQPPSGGYRLLDYSE